MTRYRVVVQGELSDRFQRGFEDLNLVRESGDTVIEGEFIDTAQLYHLLDRLQDLGLELVAVSSDDAPAGGAHGSDADE